MNKKKLIILISIIVTLTIFMCVGAFAVSQVKASQIADKLDLGEKYLEDLDYERALAVYSEVLEIDPKNVDAYLGMADVYIAMGNYEEALETLEEGYEETEARSIERKEKKVKELAEEAGVTSGGEETDIATGEGTTVRSDSEAERVPEEPDEPQIQVTYTSEWRADEYAGGYEKATLVATTLEGEEVWRYQTREAFVGDVGPVYQELGIHNGMYYFCDDGSLATFDLETGDIVWRNEDIDYNLSCAFDEEGNLYCSGYWDVDLLVIDAAGNTLVKVDRLSNSYHMPVSIALEGDYVFITYSFCDYETNDYTMHYCLNDGSIGYGYFVGEPQDGDVNLFATLPSTFSLYSGAGAWESWIYLNSDGSMEGGYYDWEMGDTGENYPNGTLYSCDWDGAFKDVTMVDHNIYSVQLSYLNLHGTPGEVTYADGQKYVCASPYGMANGEEFLIFLPGASFENYPGLYIEWWQIGGETDILPTGYYVIYNANEGVGFIGSRN